MSKVHQAGVRPRLLAGGDFFLTYPLGVACIAGVWAFQFRWWAFVAAFSLWTLGSRYLRKMANADPLYRIVFMRELREPWLRVPRGTIRELSAPPEDILPSQKWEGWNPYELACSAASWLAHRVSRH
jgi:type IV secretory pathway TrbD component